MAIGVNNNDGLDVECDLLRGQAPALTEQVDTWRVPGIDGIGAQKTGKAAETYSFVAAVFGLSASVDTWYVNMQAQAGKLCTITDDWNTAYTNILILRVTQLVKTAAIFTAPYTMALLEAAAVGDARGEVRIEGVKTK